MHCIENLGRSCAGEGQPDGLDRRHASNCSDAERGAFRVSLLFDGGTVASGLVNQVMFLIYIKSPASRNDAKALNV